MRVESQVTSLSWIPSEAVKGYSKPAFTVGVTHYDPPPPGVIEDLEALRGADGFRFANRLTAWAEFDGRELLAHGSGGGLVMGATTVHLGPIGTTFTAVSLPDLRPEPEIGDGWVRYTQTAGGRTALPLPRRIARAPYLRLQSPLVWTTLGMTLHYDGRVEVALDGASPFPRHWVYDGDGKLSLKAGVTDFQAWAAQEGPHRTPWGDEDSPVLVTAAETVDGRLLPELGPGAILGERAVLEGGRRTATLTAATRIRVAEAPADLIDAAALARLAEGHRREETLPGETPA